MDYKDKIVLITGASSDIAKSIIEFYAKCQARMIVTYCKSKEDTLEYIDKIKKKYDVDIDCLQLDLCKEESIVNLSNYVKNKYKKIDILINNASISLDNHFIDKTKNEFMKVLETNLVGTFLMMKYLIN